MIRILCIFSLFLTVLGYDETTCDVCQIIPIILRKKIEELLPKMGTSAGSRDTAIYEAMQNCCGYDDMSLFADKLGKETFLLTKPCEKILMDSEAEDIIEEMFGKNKSEKDISTKLCLNKYCKSLWKEEDHVLERKGQGEKNEQEQQEYLAKKKDEPGVKSTASGLLYEVLNKGEGSQHPEATNEVKVHYVGQTLDGVVFDSSRARNEPTQFTLRGVIPGWTEGLQLMVVGDIFRFHIPYQLAYGDSGSPPKIGPKSCLVFEVELLEIVEGEKKKKPSESPISDFKVQDNMGRPIEGVNVEVVHDEI